MEEEAQGEAMATDGWSAACQRAELSENSNEPLQLTMATLKRSEEGCNGVGVAGGPPGRGGSPTAPSEVTAGAVAPLCSTTSVTSSATLPVRFVVEFIDLPPDVRSGGPASVASRITP
ncbi:uncharacterized protein LOC119100205 [Pollicipes pollicipes]|uniref:uncharacterized protein LOC119100205 n=1 Tax=Pollicipes pollicipes TaxID=41117 RepID=UPI001884B6DD|nr:uncharacterized protein LOC119100205 [Pollicipes pollicipes]